MAANIGLIAVLWHGRCRGGGEGRGGIVSVIMTTTTLAATAMAAHARGSNLVASGSLTAGGLTSFLMYSVCVPPNFITGLCFETDSCCCRYTGFNISGLSNVCVQTALVHSVIVTLCVRFTELKRASGDA